MSRHAFSILSDQDPERLARSVAARLDRELSAKMSHADFLKDPAAALRLSEKRKVRIVDEAGATIAVLFVPSKETD